MGKLQYISEYTLLSEGTVPVIHKPLSSHLMLTAVCENMLPAQWLIVDSYDILKFTQDFTMNCITHVSVEMIAN